MTATTAPNVGPAMKGDADRERSLMARTGILIGYARCSTERQDLTAQRQILTELGVAEERVYLDHGLTGRHRSRPGLNNALAALREGDTLVVPKLDRLARSVPDARAIGDSLAARGVRLSLGGSVYDPNDPMGKCFFNILATFAEFEVDLLRMRTREGMAIARAKVGSRAKRPSSAPPNGLSCSSSTVSASTRSPSSLSCSRSAAPLYIESSRAHSREIPSATARGFAEPWACATNVLSAPHAGPSAPLPRGAQCRQGGCDRGRVFGIESRFAVGQRERFRG